MEYRNHHHHQQQQEENGLAHYINPPPPPPPSPPPPPPPTPIPALPVASSKPDQAVMYRECRRNHAASIGTHVLDGCGEFMSEDDKENAAAAMKCAACGCHRSFHRKESLPPPHPFRSKHQHPHPIMSHGSYKKQLPSPSGLVAVDVNNNSGSGATTESSSKERRDPRVARIMQQQGMEMGMALVGLKKRHRTKFTAEQKERMTEFAERIGWRFNRQDEAAVENLCREVGVRRHVLKVWMHNNKHSIKIKQHQIQQEEPQLITAAAKSAI